MQVELLDTHRCKARVEPANAVVKHLELWHNRQRRHSSLGMMTPAEFKTRQQETTAA